MQPMVSNVDHESRTGSCFGRTDDAYEAGPSESTPLLARFPVDAHHGHRDTATSVTVGLLLVILISGIVIGTYLLVEQGKEENILPPVEQAVQLVTRSQWDQQYNAQLLRASPRSRARRVVVLQTDTPPCWRLQDCVATLRDLQTSGEVKNYSFAVSSQGRTFECWGWRATPASLLENEPPTLFIAFIGNFTSDDPSAAQVKEARRLLDESISQQYLHPTYVIVGKRTKYLATQLFRAMSTFPQWDKELSDS